MYWWLMLFQSQIRSGWFLGFLCAWRGLAINSSQILVWKTSPQLNPDTYQEQYNFHFENNGTLINAQGMHSRLKKETLKGYVESSVTKSCKTFIPIKLVLFALPIYITGLICLSNGSYDIWVVICLSNGSYALHIRIWRKFHEERKTAPIYHWVDLFVHWKLCTNMISRKFHDRKEKLKPKTIIVEVKIWIHKQKASWALKNMIFNIKSRVHK